MNFTTKLDFCAILSPFSTNGKYVIFVTYSGHNKVEPKLCLENDYEIFKYLLAQHGFTEIDYCTFELEDNISIHIEELKLALSKSGLNYSKSFELSILNEMNNYQKAVQAKLLDTNNKIQFSSNAPCIVNNKVKSKIPAVGETMTLHFYLFLQCHFFNENDCVLEIIGDLYSKENTNNRNFLQITKSDFVRIESAHPGVITLQSVNTYGDFMNSVNFLHKGNFKFSKEIFNEHGDRVQKIKEFTYNIMEIKKNVNPNHKIVVEANLNQYYDDMIYVSKKIKKELTQEQKKVVPLEPLIPEIIKLKNKFQEKMLTLAEADEFEKANVLKNDIGFIENKIKIIDTLEEKNITRQEYFKSFCLNA